MGSKTAESLFPNGIKLCYAERDEDINPIKNYFPIYNPNPDLKFYGVTYYFYIKKENSEFAKEYDITPIKQEVLDYIYELQSDSELCKQEINYILKRLEVLKRLMKRKYVYIPYCACLVTKYPLIEQMEKSLKSIVNVLCDENSNIKDLNEYFSYMIDSIPYPPYNTSILFPLANNFGKARIKPCNLKELNLTLQPSFLLNCMRKRNILLLFKLLLSEKKILIVGEDIAKVSKVILNFLALLYPFKWVNSCMSALSETMLGLLNSFLPFFFGIRTDLFKAIISDTKIADDIFIFYLDKDEFEISKNLKNKKKEKVKDFIETNVKSLPGKLEAKFKEELGNIQHKLKLEDKNNVLNRDMEIRNLFMQVISELLFGFEVCLNKVGEYFSFNKNTFLKNKKEDEKPFFEELFDYQIFSCFIGNYIFKDDKENYFKKRFKEFEGYKKKELSFKKCLDALSVSLKRDYQGFTDIKYKYKIKPFFNENNEIENNKIVENKRIFTNIRELPEYNNDPNELKIYAIPGQEIKNPTKKKSSKITIINDEENNTKNKINKFIYYGYDLSEVDKDLESDLNILLRNIYNNLGRIEEDEKKTIINYLKTRQGRNIFLRILMENHSNKKVEEFGNESFYDFLIIFKNVLLFTSNSEEEEKNDNNLIYFMKILKLGNKISTTEITSKNKKIVVTISDKLYHDFVKYPLIYTERFWEIWIEDALSGKLLKIKELNKTENPNLFDNLENYDKYRKKLVDLIKSLIPIMLKMNMNENSIISLIKKLEDNYIDDMFAHKEIEESLLGQLQLYKLSKK